MIAQIDEQHAAMVALAVDPARKADGLADIGGASARRRCVSDRVHRNSFHSDCNKAGGSARLTGDGRAFVKPRARTGPYSEKST